MLVGFVSPSYFDGVLVTPEVVGGGVLMLDVGLVIVGRAPPNLSEISACTKGLNLT